MGGRRAAPLLRDALEALPLHLQAHRVGGARPEPAHEECAARLLARAARRVVGAAPHRARAVEPRGVVHAQLGARRREAARAPAARAPRRVAGHAVRIKTIRRNQADAIAQQAFIATDRGRAEGARARAGGGGGAPQGDEDAEWSARRRRAVQAHVDEPAQGGREGVEGRSSTSCRATSATSASLPRRRSSRASSRSSGSTRSSDPDEAPSLQDWLNNAEINKNRFQKEFVREARVLRAADARERRARGAAQVARVDRAHQRRRAASPRTCCSSCPCSSTTRTRRATSATRSSGRCSARCRSS